MAFSVAERVASLVDEVTRVERESEGAYLVLGRLFPALVAEMDLSSRNAAESLAGFSSLTSSSSDSSLHSMAAFAAQSGAFFKSVHDRDSGFLLRINESIERLATLEDVIGRVRSDSEEMEIISLNAMTVALKSGTAGKAFSVITDELKRLSTRTIGLTELITARGRDLMDCFSGLRDSLRELDRFQEDFFSTLDTTLTEGYQGLDREIRTAVDSFSALIGEAKGVREPVQNIMMGIQLQDIIRQSLQHVTISLREAMDAAREAEGIAPDGSGEELGADQDDDFAFVASIAELAASLLEDVIGKLDHGASDFGRLTGAIQDLVQGVEAKRRDFVKGLSDRKAGDGGSTLNFAQASGRYLELKKKVILTARRLAEQVKDLDESFRGLAGLLSRFQNIVVASRIEVAKNTSLAGVANTVQGMVQLTDRISLDVGEAMDTTKDFIKVAYGAIAEYAGTESSALARPGRTGADAALGGKGSRDAASESERLQSTLSRVEGDLQSLAEARAKVGAAIGDFLLYTPEFISLIGEARTQLRAMEDFSAKLKFLRAETLDLHGDIAQVSSGDLSAAAIRSERLRTMIEKFTIFTHKKTAGAIGSFDVEEGVEAGEVTLF